jgi:hypothetical protein
VNWRHAFLFCTTLVMDLLPGRRLEVLSELGESAKKKKGWWGAIVTKSSYYTLTSSPQSPMIRYDAMHGYDATDSKIIFTNSSYSRQDHRNVKMSGVSVLHSNWSEMSVRFMLSHPSAT